MTDWQSIETAPRNRPIELYRPPTSNTRITYQCRVVGVWNDDEGGFIWPSQLSCWPDFDDTSWVEDQDFFVSATDWTHWREVTSPATA